jgi:hypothetical protein
MSTRSRTGNFSVFGAWPWKKKRTATTSRKDPKRRHRIRNTIIIVVALLVVIRIVLPYFVLKYVNKKLAGLEDYYGHVDDIDLSLYRGAYIIKDLKILKTEKVGKRVDSIPFFKTPAIDLSVQWKALFKGRIVGEIYVESPVLNFVAGKHKDENIKQDTADFRQLVKDLMPLTVNHFEINEGRVHFIDKNSSPKVDASIKNLDVVATNLSNVNKSEKRLPANLVATAEAYEGKLYLTTDFDGLNKIPTFDLSAKFTDINMVLLNDVLRAYGNFDVKKGKFGLYTEFAAKNGEFGGYVKPAVTDLDVVQWNKEEGNLGQILWETLVGSGLEVVQNQRTEILATKLPISGKFSDPNVNTWRAISYVLRNAFFNALKPAIDNTINIKKLEEDGKKTFLERIFGSKDKSKEKKEKRKEKEAEEKKDKSDKKK